MEGFITNLAWCAAVVGIIGVLVNAAYFIMLHGTEAGRRRLALCRVLGIKHRTYVIPWAIVTIVDFMWIYR